MWFEWASEDSQERARFFLHEVPQADLSKVEAWMKRHDELSGEFRIAANVRRSPISASQKATLRPLGVISADLQAVADQRPRWETAPPVGWFAEFGQDFAAIRVVPCTREEAAALPLWQHAVARALADADQIVLDQLFAKVPAFNFELTFYMVRLANSDGDERCIACDWRGKFLSEGFLLTAKHIVQDLTSCLVAKDGKA